MGRGLGFDPDSLLLLSKRSFKGKLNAFFYFILLRSIVERLYIYIYIGVFCFRLLNILSEDFSKGD